MSASGIRCPACGASDGHAAVGFRVRRCAYCGQEFQLEEPTVTRQPVIPSPTVIVNVESANITGGESTATLLAVRDAVRETVRIREARVDSATYNLKEPDFESRYRAFVDELKRLEMQPRPRPEPTNRATNKDSMGPGDGLSFVVLLILGMGVLAFKVSHWLGASSQVAYAAGVWTGIGFAVFLVAFIVIDLMAGRRRAAEASRAAFESQRQVLITRGREALALAQRRKSEWLAAADSREAELTAAKAALEESIAELKRVNAVLAARHID